MNIKRAVLATLISTFTVAIVLFGLVITTSIIGSDEESSTMTTVEPNPQPTSQVDDALPSTESHEAPILESITCGVKNGSCSKDEIAKHNSQSDCWVIYRGSYYDVTSYVKVHSGGTAVFNISTCGQDIQEYLEGNAPSAGRQEEHGSSAYTDLEKLKIGSIVN